MERLSSKGPQNVPADAVPPTIEAAFSVHAMLGTQQVARLLEMDVKTLRKHIGAGELVGRLKGLGRKRRHRVFTLSDVTRFLNRPDEDASCRSIVTKTARTGNSTSRSTVIAFPDRPNSPVVNVTRRPSRMGKKHAITDDMVSKMVEARRLDVRRSGRDSDGKQLYRPITARTVNKTTLSLLRRVMHRARDNWNATILREPKWKKHWLKETKRPIREITLGEEAILDDAEDADFAALRRFGIITGLRRRNLILTWPQVDFAAAEVRVITKGGVPRVVPLSREAYAILWARRGQHETNVFTFVAQRTRPCPKTGKRFIRGQRYPITYYGMGSNKRKWAKVGVDARIHDMRHTTGSRTLRKTGNLKVTQELLGHSDIAITAKFYANVMIEDVRAAMEMTSAVPIDDQAVKKTIKIPE